MPVNFWSRWISLTWNQSRGSPRLSQLSREPQQESRSTVGTVTEIYDYLRVLFARIASRTVISAAGNHFPDHSADGRPDHGTFSGIKIILFAPFIQDRKGEYRKELSQLRKSGFVRIRVDGVIRT